MPISFEEFRIRRGFTKDPFAITNAEQELPLLPSFFVRIPWFDRLIGDTTSPESLILFAPQGHGKTSHRLEVGRLAMEADKPALVVPFTECELLNWDEQQPQSFLSYLQPIIRVILEMLLTQLDSQPRRWKLLISETDAHARLLALISLYQPIRPQPAENISAKNTYVELYKQERIGVKTFLTDIARIAKICGFASIYLLVDGVDELPDTSRNPLRAANKVRPLLDSPGVLQECGIAFKFFLPSVLKDVMQKHEIGRLDRIPYYELTWRAHDLILMLKGRLASYSRTMQIGGRGRVNSFQDLCTDPCDVDQRLALVANSSPRRMIELARKIVQEHCDHTEDVDDLIWPKTVSMILQDIPKTIVRETSSIGPSTQQDSSARPTISEVSTNTIPTVFFDERGTIWIGENQLNVQLTKLQYKCLSYLWQNRERVVEYDELVNALYSSGRSSVDRVNPKQSLTKIIQQLRTYLNPSEGNIRTYIDVQSGIGYILRNFRDDNDRVSTKYH